MKRSIQKINLFDVLRVGLYLTMVRFLWADFNVLPNPDFARWTCFFVLIGFILVDLAARTRSRWRIFEEYDHTEKPFMFLQALSFASEIIGLVFYYWFATNLIKTFDIGFTKSGTYYGLFCISTAAHNAFFIRMERYLGFASFCKEIFTRDYTELDDISGRWGGSLVAIKQKKTRKMVARFRLLVRILKNFKHFKHPFPCGLFNKTLFFLVLYSCLLGSVHFFIQLMGFHVFYLNLLVGFKILLELHGPIPVGLQLVFFIGLLIVFFIGLSYSLVSYQEMGRRYYQEKCLNKKEKRWQLLGNCTLFFLMLFLILLLPKWLLIISFFCLQAVVTIGFLALRSEQNYQAFLEELT